MPVNLLSKQQFILLIFGVVFTHWQCNVFPEDKQMPSFDIEENKLKKVNTISMILTKSMNSSPSSIAIHETN